jgi:HEPN domain-containing protein
MPPRCCCDEAAESTAAIWSAFTCSSASRHYLKARLEEAAIAFPKIHDLSRLLTLTLTIEPLWETLRPAMTAITNYAVEARYPGRLTTPAEATGVLRATTHMRSLIRVSLGLR